MAERYGGRYSPGGTPPGSGEQPPAPPAGLRNGRASRVSLRARSLFLLPLPLLFAGLGAIGRGNATEMVGELGGFAGLMLSAWLLNEGQRAEEAYAARTIARPPAVPRKLFAAVLTGVSVAAAGLLGGGQAPAAALIFGLVAAGAQVVAFGLDPMRKKGLAGVDEFSNERVARAIDRAEGLVRETAEAARRFGDRRLEGRVERICDQAREVFRAVEQDPRDLNRARTFLSVYLLGLRDATVKFADLWGRSRDAAARAQYEALLGDLETSFGTHRTALLADNRSDLDIEIEVLRERLQQDGLVARERGGTRMAEETRVQAEAALKEVEAITANLLPEPSGASWSPPMRPIRRRGPRSRSARPRSTCRAPSRSSASAPPRRPSCRRSARRCCRASAARTSARRATACARW